MFGFFGDVLCSCTAVFVEVYCFPQDVLLVPIVDKSVLLKVQIGTNYSVKFMMKVKW